MTRISLAGQTAIRNQRPGGEQVDRGRRFPLDARGFEISGDFEGVEGGTAHGDGLPTPGSGVRAGRDDHSRGAPARDQQAVGGLRR